MRITFALVILLFFIACNNSKGEKSGVPVPQALPPQYYFYPRANVYFDSANKEYLFQTGDSVGWTTQKQIPAAVQSMMDKGVAITNPLEPVWKDNANHKLIYSVALYATAEDTIEKKEPPPVIVKPDTVEKKKRSGFRRFFDKLFGKNKKGKAQGATQ